jgi:hypothetical protein
MFQEARGLKTPEEAIQNPRKMIIIEGPRQAATRIKAAYVASVEHRKQGKVNLANRKQKLREMLMAEQDSHGQYEVFE